MDVNGLYNFALLMVLVGFIVSVGVLALDKFGSSTGISADASTAINASRDAVAEINTTWMSLIVTIGVLAIIIGLIISGFAYFRGR